MKDEALMDRAKQYAKAHIDACDNWPHGRIDDVWIDKSGHICIQYEDGSWWHYKEEAGEVTWW